MTDNAIEATPQVVLSLDGDTEGFKAHPDANQFLLARHLDQLGEAGMPSLKAVIVLVRDQVLDEERARLDDYLLRHGRADDFAQKLYDAIEACWDGRTNLPLEQPSNSSEATPETDVPGRSSTASSSSPVMPEPEFIPA